MKLKQLILAFAFAIALFATTNANAAVDFFIRIDGIPGESTDTDHQGWIDVLSVSQGINRSVDTATGRLEAAKPGPFTFRKRIDKSSPLLARALVTGEVIPKVEIELTRSYGTGGTRAVYYKYELTNVLVTSYSVSGAGAADDVPAEDFSLNYTEIRFEYTDRDATTGAEKGKVEATWKVEEGEA